MKCAICKINEADYVTTKGYSVCRECVDENDFVICTQCGKVVPVAKDKHPYAESLCEECFNQKED